MRRLLGKLIPRSTGGRWAAGLSLLALAAVAFYVAFYVFAVHLLFVDEVVDEEAPEFAVEVDIDELISEALETGPATTTAAVSSDAEPTDEGPATDQSMSVGEHSADEVDASDGSTGSGDSAGATGSAEVDASDGSTGSADSAGATGSAESGETEGAAESDAGSGSSGEEDQGVRVAYVGSFGPRSHPAEGTAVVLTDGTQTFLRFDDDFATDNGPDLNVYLHTAGPDASVDDLVGDFIDLGDLKGNIGAQNYVVPEDIDLDRYSTVSVWCVRFRVVFGTAELAPMN